jgi:hypothetical protein
MEVMDFAMANRKRLKRPKREPRTLKEIIEARHRIAKQTEAYLRMKQEQLLALQILRNIAWKRWAKSRPLLLPDPTQ